MIKIIHAYSDSSLVLSLVFRFFFFWLVKLKRHESQIHFGIFFRILFCFFFSDTNFRSQMFWKGIFNAFFHSLDTCFAFTCAYKSGDWTVCTIYLERSWFLLQPLLHVAAEWKRISIIQCKVGKIIIMKSKHKALPSTNGQFK